MQGIAVTAPSAHIKETSTQTFVADVIEASKTQPVLVDFWAPWCGPCKQLTPTLEKVINAANGKVKLVKMNIDEHPAIPGQLGVQSIPTVIAFKDGRPVDAFMGALPESQVKQFIDGLAADSSAAADLEASLKAGEEALHKGDGASAVDHFAAVLAAEPENMRALGGMVQAYVKAGELSHAKAILAQVPEAKAGEASIASARAAIELAEKGSSVGDLEPLRRQVAHEPENYQARYDLALGLAASGRREEAVDELIAIVRRKPDWNEEAARKQLLQFFDAWGFADDAAIYGRKKLSSLLFA